MSLACLAHVTFAANFYSSMCLLSKKNDDDDDDDEARMIMADLYKSFTMHD